MNQILFHQSKFSYDKNIKNSEIISKNCEICEIGLGDILLCVNLLKKNIINKPIYINLEIFKNNIYELNNIKNALEFRLLLLNKICDDDEICFYDDGEVLYTNLKSKYCNLKNMILLHKYFDFSKNYDREYIIFHTKLRLTRDCNYEIIKDNIKTFCTKFKSNYMIIIMGERNMPNNFETRCHNIQTIYTQLLELKNNNNILDLTIDNIYDNLNFENYCKDISIIHNAKTNILFGNGGSFCLSVCFGKNINVFLPTKILVDKIFFSP